MKLKLIASLLLSCAALPASLSTYRIVADTSTLNGSAGYLDFQFNPANAFTDPASATVFGFTTNATLNPAGPFNGTAGSVTGTLPGNLAFTNASAFNDYFEAVQFGSMVDFLVTLNVTPSSGATSGSLFLFSLYGADGVTPLLSSSVNGEIASVILDPDGTSSGAGNSVASVTATPEPSGWAMAAAGGLLLAFARRAKIRRPLN